LAANSTHFSAETISEGYKMVAFGIDLIIAISSKPIYDGPSGPIDIPAWEPRIFKFELEIPAILI